MAGRFGRLRGEDDSAPVTPPAPQQPAWADTSPTPQEPAAPEPQPAWADPTPTPQEPSAPAPDAPDPSRWGRTAGDGPKAAEPEPVRRPWEIDIDLEETSAAMKQAEREAPLRLQELMARADNARSWATRSELLEMDASGTQAADIPRAAEMDTADEYDEMSRHAIQVLNKYFASDDCSEIHMGGPAEIFAKLNGDRVRMQCAFSNEEEYNHYIEDLVRQANTHWTFEDIVARHRGVLRLAGGHRMAVMFPPASDSASVSIHKIVARTWQMRSLVDNGTLNVPMANFLRAAVRGRANILICGTLGAGKSTMLSLLAQEISPDERIAILEEVPEIFLEHVADARRFTYYPDGMTEYPLGLNEILDTSLYKRFDRIIVGELHASAGGAHNLLDSMAYGPGGSMTTFHAGNAQEAVARLRNAVLVDKPQMPSHVVAESVRSAVNLVVILRRVDGKHRVAEIAEVNHRATNESSDAVTLSPLWVHDPAEDRFHSPARLDAYGRIIEKGREVGVHFDPDWVPGGAQDPRRVY